MLDNQLDKDMSLLPGPVNISKTGSNFSAVRFLTNCVVINSYSDDFPGSRVAQSSLVETRDLASSNHRSKVSMHA